MQSLKVQYKPFLFQNVDHWCASHSQRGHDASHFGVLKITRKTMMGVNLQSHQRLPIRTCPSSQAVDRCRERWVSLGDAGHQASHQLPNCQTLYRVDV